MNSSWSYWSTSSGGSIKKKPVSGLKNTGNTCFFNSAIQFLNAIRPIAYPIQLRRSVPSDSNTDEDMGFYNQMITCFESISRSMREYRKEKIFTSIDPSQLFKLMELKYDGICHGIQGDAHEVLTLVLDAVIRGTNKNHGEKREYYDPDGNNDIQDEYKKSHNAKLKGLDSPFERYVETTEISRTKCMHCDYTSIGFQHGIGLSLPLPSDPDTDKNSSSKDQDDLKSISKTHIVVYVQDINMKIHEARFYIPTSFLHVDYIYHELQELYYELSYNRLAHSGYGYNISNVFYITAYNYEFDMIGLEQIIERILSYYHRDDEENTRYAYSQIEFSPCSDSGEDECHLESDVTHKTGVTADDDLRASSLNRESIVFTNEDVKNVAIRASEFAGDLNSNHLIVITMLYNLNYASSRKQYNNHLNTSSSSHSYNIIRTLKVNMSLCIENFNICAHDNQHGHGTTSNLGQADTPRNFCNSTLAFSYSCISDDSHLSNRFSPKQNDICQAGLEILLVQYDCYLRSIFGNISHNVINVLLSSASYTSSWQESSTNLSTETTIKYYLKENVITKLKDILGNLEVNASINFDKLFEPRTGLFMMSCHSHPLKSKNFWSLDDCFKEYTKTSSIDGWRCGKMDHANPSGENGTALYKAPPYLIIHLKRFDQIFDEYGRIHFVKKEDTVRYPHVLDISSYVENKSDSNTKYRLIAVICHSGNTNYGHYFAYILSRETGEWWEANDERVVPISPDKVVTPLAYTLLYRSISEDLDSHEREMRNEYRIKMQTFEKEHTDNQDLNGIHTQNSNTQVSNDAPYMNQSDNLNTYTPNDNDNEGENNKAATDSNNKENLSDMHSTNECTIDQSTQEK